MNEKSIIYCWEIRSDDLNVYLASSKKGALRVGLSLRRAYDCLAYFTKAFPLCSIFKDYDMNRPLIEAVEGVLQNRPTDRGLPLDISCTPFQMKAWKAIARIPFGQTKPYGEVARMVGRPGGARAIGPARGRNPLSLIFP